MRPMTARHYPEERLGHGEDAPIAVGHKITGEMVHPEPKTHSTPNGNLVISGSEYLGRVVVPYVSSGTGTVPAGGVLFYTQLSPLTFDGSRIRQLSQMYEQWRFSHLVIEYVPNCPTTSAGGLVGYCTGDISQNTSLVTGDGGVREAFSRAGSMSMAVWEHGAFALNASQQKWYFTALNDTPELSIPASFQLISNTDFTVTSSATQLGQIFCHYVLEFRVPSVEDNSAFSYSASNGNLTFSGIARVADDAVVLPLANFAPGAAFQDEGVVGYCTIVAADDTGPASAVWRTWASPVTGDTYTLGPGMLLFFRAIQLNAANKYWVFFPTLSAALNANNAQGGENFSAWQFPATIAAPAATCGFKVGPIRGLQLGPDG